MDRPELKVLYGLLLKWGFYEHGTKTTAGKEEVVLVKKLGIYNETLTPKQNFPNLEYSHQKFFLPIEAKYHTPLLPDSQLKTENEVDFLGEQPQKYALQKVYISFSYKRNMNPGDFLVLYRKGTTPGKKAYESVITTIGIIDEVAYNFKNKEEFLKYCENRTVFNSNELEYFWRTKKETLLVIKFIYVKSLCKRLTLSYLWDKRIIQPCSGPRPFDIISDSDFDLLLNDSNTEIYIVR